MWFGVADTLKLLKPSGAGLVKNAQGCQLGTLLILNHDSIPYLKMKRNFIHTLFWGTPLFWGSGYQTIMDFRISKPTPFHLILPPQTTFLLYMYSLGSRNTATMHFFYTILANSELKPHAPISYQSKLVPGGSIISNKCEGSTSRP